MNRIVGYIFLFGNFVPYLVVGSNTPLGVENPLKGALELLQLKSLNTARKEQSLLMKKNENCKSENLILKQTSETMLKDMDEDIKRMREEYEKKIDQLKKESFEKDKQIENDENNHKEEMKRSKKSHEEKIKELDATFVKKEAKLKKDQKEAVELIKSEFEGQIKGINSTKKEQEKVFQGIIEDKKVLARNMMNVLEDTYELIDKWLDTVKLQSSEIDENNEKISEYRKIEETALEIQMAINKQDVAIEQLENIIINNQNITESYISLIENDLEKRNCNDGQWSFKLMSSLMQQETQMKTLNAYFKNRNEIKDHIITIEKLIDSINVTQSDGDDVLLISHYQELFIKQSSSISMLRKILTNLNNPRTDLYYEEDSDGHLISVTPATCIPTPPSYSGLELSNAVFSCADNISSTYVMECTKGMCRSDTWPVCNMSIATQNMTWEEPDTSELASASGSNGTLAKTEGDSRNINKSKMVVQNKSDNDDDDYHEYMEDYEYYDEIYYPEDDDLDEASGMEGASGIWEYNPSE